MLTEKDINIFTIVKDKNNISPLRQWCIDSWHKCMPNANIMIFDDNDLNNPNWIYYDVIKNDKLYCKFDTNNDFKYVKEYHGDFNWYIKLPLSKCNASTDSIRLKLLQYIPNALYIDSDGFMNESVLKYCNLYDTWILDPHNDYNNNKCVATWFTFVKDRSKFIDNLIDFLSTIESNNHLIDSFAFKKCCDKYGGIFDLNLVVDNTVCNHMWLSVCKQLYLQYSSSFEFKNKKIYKIYYTFDNIPTNHEKYMCFVNKLHEIYQNDKLKYDQQVCYIFAPNIGYDYKKCILDDFDNFDERIYRVFLLSKFNQMTFEKYKYEFFKESSKYIHDLYNAEEKFDNVVFERIFI